MPSFNLVDQRWVPVITTAGKPATLSLTETMLNADTILDVVNGPHDSEHLTAATIMRLLQAIHQAAARDNIPVSQWLANHRDDFDLFHPDRPFAQNSDMRVTADATAKPANALALFSAGEGPILLDHDHSHTGTQYNPAHAARLLLVRQAFGPSGIQPFPQKIYGPDAKNGTGPMCALRPYLWLQRPTLAATLEANDAPGPVGEFLFTWPSTWTPGQRRTPRGQLDALTWPSRSVLLLPDEDGMVSKVTYCNGAALGADSDPQVTPHTLFVPEKDSTTDGWVAVRPGTQPAKTKALFQAWARPTHRGIIEHARRLPPEHTQGVLLRWAGLVSHQSRLDGVMDITVPVPTIPDETISEALDVFETARTKVWSRVTRIIDASPQRPGDKKNVRVNTAVDAFAAIGISWLGSVADETLPVPLFADSLAAAGEGVIRGVKSEVPFCPSPKPRTKEKHDQSPS